MAESLSTVLGKFRGGPAGGLMRVTYDVKAGGVVKGEYKGKSGGVAGFEGKMVEKGKKVLGFWCVGVAGRSGRLAARSHCAPRSCTLFTRP